MPRRRKGRPINGMVLLDKAVGGSSNQVLQQLRRLYQAQKAGHTGALDPLASGMLPICFGEATKFSQYLLDADKTYQVTAQLGVRTTTSDADGEVVERRDVTSSELQVRQVCQSFEGAQKQIPTMFSALKYQGKPLYTYARQGITVPREARDITIYALSVDSIELPNVRMTVHCSKGTYIRTLVDDIGEKLGCGAYVTRLHRSAVANFPSERMLRMEEFEALAQKGGIDALDEQLLPMDTSLQTLSSCNLNTQQTLEFSRGMQIKVSDPVELHAEQQVRVYGDANQFLGVAVAVNESVIQPKRVVVY